jgi:copper homeostasis protein
MIIICALLFATGIVIGIQNNEGGVDTERLRMVRELSQGMQLTYHRAFDLVSDYKSAIETIVAVGCDRLLTSGQEKYAHLAASTKLRHIVELCRDRIHVLAAAGITADNVRPLVINSQTHGVHVGGAVNRNVLSDIAGLDTPLFSMAAEMKVWRCTHMDLIKHIVDITQDTWRELDMMYGRDR